jgi:hypothetical protein
MITPFSARASKDGSVVVNRLSWRMKSLSSRARDTECSVRSNGSHKNNHSRWGGIGGPGFKLIGSTFDEHEE